MYGKNTGKVYDLYGSEINVLRSLVVLHTSMTGGYFYVLKKSQIFLKIRNNFAFSCRDIYGEEKLSAAEPEMGTDFATQLNTTRPRDTEYRAKVCKDSGESRAKGKGDFIQELL